MQNFKAQRLEYMLDIYPQVPTKQMFARMLLPFSLIPLFQFKFEKFIRHIKSLNKRKEQKSCVPLYTGCKNTERFTNGVNKI